MRPLERLDIALRCLSGRTIVAAGGTLALATGTGDLWTLLQRIEAGATWASIWPAALISLSSFTALVLMTIACALTLDRTRGAGARVTSALVRAREAEARVRAFQDSAPVAIVALDTRYTIVDWNRAAEQLFGYTRAEMIGRHGVDVMVPTDRRAFVMEMLERFVLGNQYTHIGDRIQLTLLRAGGQSVPVELALSHYKTRQGLVFTMHLRDVRAQRDAAEALRLSERRHRVVVDGLREIIFQADRHGVLTYLNQAWRRTTHFAIEDSLGCTLFEFVVDEDRARLERLFASLPERASDGMVVEPIEARFLTSELGTRLLLVVAHPLADADGQVSGVVGTVEDITEKRAAEIRLRDQLRFNRDLLEVIPIPVAVRSVAGEYLAVNRAWERFSGKDRSTVLGRPMVDLFPRVIVDEIARAEASLIESGGARMAERQLRAADGGERTVLHYSSAFVRDNGAASGLITAFVDITEQKRAEATIRSAKETAEAANLAKNAFLERISHEVRTPLAGILGMTALALETDLDTEQREYLASVQSSADNLLHIIDDVLDVPRIEAGEIQLAHAPYDPRAMAGAVMRMAALAARSKGIEPLLSVAPEVPHRLSGDADRLRQVLSNLLSNAIKFTDTGEVELAIACPTPGMIEFAVRDTGRGMSDEARARILAAGSEPDGWPRGAGGLGIAIVTQLVRLMGGSPLAIDTTLGEGSVVRFALPIADGIPAAAARCSMQALVIADHDRTRAILAAMLAERGIAVVTAAGAAAAEDLVSHAGCHIAFVEAATPDTDGYALAAALHARRPELAICMLIDAGVGVGESARHARDGIFGYLRKPVLAADLDRTLALVASPELPALSREAVASVEAPTAGITSIRGARVLVAEDHPVNQAIVRRRLQNLGHQVTLVADGAAAVEACSASGFDIVLMDVEMPVMNGLEATRRIRMAEATSGRRTPIIALTALAFEHDREVALAAGMDGYLVKPVSPDALAQVLQEHCRAPA